jgi:uncharacterized SAM-binding protein YcdF (DUF218 family)
MRYGQTDDDVTTRRAPQAVFSKPGWSVRRTLRVSSFILLVCVGILIGGFLRFADNISSMQPPEHPQVDAIVVLTGGAQRIDQALDLLKSGIGKRLLISGVHPSTSAMQLRKLTNSSNALFKCCVDIGYSALDTIGNANETLSWIRDKQYHKVLVVTNNYHMPRSLFELQRIDPITEFVPYPVVNSDLKMRNWLTDPQIVKAMIVEYLKLAAAVVRSKTGLMPTDGLRRAKTE